jgi:uncharacterized protein involved in type VI secretion and phage assembly
MSLYEFQKNRVYGLVLGLVTNNQDPDNMGRVKVKYHMLDQAVESDWCRVVNFYAGKDRGNMWLPEVEDEVVLGFEHGDVNFPYVLGAVFNGKDTPPIGKNKDNDLKRLKSRSGHEFTFDDKKGNEKITLWDKARKNMIEIDVKKDKITILAETGFMDIFIKKKIHMKCEDLLVEASKSITYKSGGPIDVKAAKDITVKGDKAMKIEAAQKINVESKGAAIEMKASTMLKGQAAQFEIKASGPGKMESGGPLTIKGAIVNIN